MLSLDQRIDRLERTVAELHSELATLRVLAHTDFPSALNKIRFITEKILAALCKHHNVSWGPAEPTLENMIGPLIAHKVIPRPIAIHVRSIQTNSSPGSHFQEEALSSSHLEIAQMALVEFLEWYYTTHPSHTAVSPPPIHKPPSKPFPLLRVIAGLTLVFLTFLATFGIILYYAYKLNPPATTQNADTLPSNGTIPSPPILPPDTTDPNNPDVKLATEYEARINRCLASQNFLQAIAATADYNLAVSHRAPAPSIQNQRFRSDLHHLTFTSPDLSDFRPNDVPLDKTTDDNLRAVGIQILLSLLGPTADDRFWVAAMDYDQISRRLGSARSNTPDIDTKLFAQQALQGVATVQDSSLQTIRGMRLQRFTLKAEDATTAMDALGLSHEGVSYLFVSSSTASAPGQARHRLDSIISSLAFDDNPALEKSIQAVTNQITSADNPTQLLTAARQLLLLKQYREASLQLSSLTAAIAKLLPKPVIEGDTAHDYTYGITFKVPDARWKLSTEPIGVMNGIMAEDTSTTPHGGIVISTINPLLAFGPQGRELFSSDAPDEVRRNSMRGAAQGAIVRSNGTIESEGFTTFRGHLAYVASGTTKSSSVKVRALVVEQPQCLLMAIAIGPSTSLNQYQNLIDKNLTLPSPPATAPGL